MTPPNVQPSIYLGTLRIDEPVVLLTNLLITAVCWSAYFSLRKRGGTSKMQRYFRSYFLLMGSATVLGGFFGHAFFYAFGLPFKIPGWSLSMCAVTLLPLASLPIAKPWLGSGSTTPLSILLITELLAMMVLSIVTVNFKWVEIHSTIALVTLFFLHSYVFVMTKSTGSLMFVLAVMVISLSAVVFTTKISLGPWFNHLDISHVFMAAGTYLFYRGAVLLRE